MKELPMSIGLPPEAVPLPAAGKPPDMPPALGVVPAVALGPVAPLPEVAPVRPGGAPVPPPAATPVTPAAPGVLIPGVKPGALTPAVGVVDDESPVLELPPHAASNSET